MIVSTKPWEGREIEEFTKYALKISINNLRPKK